LSAIEIGAIRLRADRSGAPHARIKALDFHSGNKIGTRDSANKLFNARVRTSRAKSAAVLRYSAPAYACRAASRLIKIESQ